MLKLKHSQSMGLIFEGSDPRFCKWTIATTNPRNFLIVAVQAVTTSGVRVEVTDPDNQLTSMQVSEVAIFGHNKLTLTMNSGQAETDAFAGRVILYIKCLKFM